MRFGLTVEHADRLNSIPSSNPVIGIYYKYPN
jgi:hypothetical protein